MHHLQLLGDARVRGRDGVVHVLERHDAAILAVLLIRGAMARPDLARLIWSGSGDDAARASLRQRLSKLNRALGSEIAGGDQTIRIADGVVHDLWYLNANADEHADVPDRRLLAALSFEGTGRLAQWVSTAREQCDAAWRRWAEARVHSLVAQGRPEAAVELAMRWILREPLVDSGHRALIRLHLERGDTRGAQEAARRCLDHLETAGLRPGAATRDLIAVVDSMERYGRQRSAAPPPGLTSPPRTIGRERLIERIDAAWRRGLLVVLDGESGVGKSRLLLDICARVPGRIYFSFRAAAGRSPYGGLAALLEHVRGSLSLPFPGVLAGILDVIVRDSDGKDVRAVHSGELIHASVDYLVAARGHGLSALAIDDLEAADPATTEALLRVAEATTPKGIHWLLSASRPEGTAYLRQWSSTHQGLVDRVSVIPFTAEETIEFMISLALPGMSGIGARAWAHRLQIITAGQPLHILECLLSAWRIHGVEVFELNAPPSHVEGLPATMALLYADRAGALSAPALALARVMAMVGESLTAEAAAKALGLPRLMEVSEAWAELEAQRVLVPDSARFVSESFRVWLQSQVPTVVGQSIHARIARHAVELGLSNEQAGDHWAKAGEDAEAAVQFQRAAELAKARNRREEERDLWTRAAASFDAAGEGPAAFQARYRAAQAGVATLPGEDAIAAAMTLQREARTADQRLDAELVRFEAVANLRKVDEALHASDAALRAVDELKSSMHPAALSTQAGRASLYRAVALAMAGRHDDALTWVERATATEPDGADDRWRLDCEQTAGYVHAHADRFAAADHAYTTAADMAARLDDQTEAIAANTWLAQVLIRRGAHERALRAAMQCEAAHRSLGSFDGLVAMVPRVSAGALLVRMGQFTEGLARLEAALAHFEELGALQFEVTCRQHIARAYLHLDDPHTAHERLGAWPNALDQGRIYHRALQLEIDAQMGKVDLDAATQLAEQARSAPLLEHALAVLLVADLDPVAERQVAICDELILRLPGDGFEAVELEARVRRAQALVTIGSSVAAASDCDRILALQPEFRPVSMYLGRFMLRLVQALRALDRAHDAEGQLRVAFDWLSKADPPAELHKHFRARHRTNAVLRDLLLAEGLEL